MTTLQRLNVVKVVDSEEKAKKLETRGFVRVESVVTSEVETVVATTSDTTFDCPFCEMVYKKEEYLKKHIAKKHPNDGGDGNGTDTGKDSTGGQE